MKKIIALYMLFLAASYASGQTEKIINPADLKQQTVISEPLSLNKGFLRAGLFYTHATLDKYFDEKKEKNYFPESTWGSSTSIQLWLQYGISDRLMVELGIPYVNDLTNIHRRYYIPENNSTKVYNGSNRGKGIGDIIASATYQIIPSKDNNFSVKANLDLTLPTGRKDFKNVKSEDEYDGPSGYGAFKLTPRITARLLSYPYSFIAYASFNYNFSTERMLYPTDKKETKITDGSSFLGGISANLHLNEWIALVNDINYTHWGKDKIEGVSPDDLVTKWALAYEPRIVFQIRRFRLGEAVNIPLKGKYVGADVLYVLMAQYVF